MLRFVLASVAAALAGYLSAAPAVAAPASNAMLSAASPFGAPALADQALSEVHGMGLTKAGYMQAQARENFDAFSGQVATILPVTFDNWFNDNGTPLIVANLSR